MEDLKPCPLCGSTDITCFAEYDGDSYENEPIYRAVVWCLGCHEDGCDPSYDEEPCCGIEAYFRADHSLIRDAEDPSDCERVLERHMAERWNRRAERTCRVEVERRKLSQTQTAVVKSCSECGFEFGVEKENTFPFEVTLNAVVPPNFCPNCGAKVIGETE